MPFLTATELKTFIAVPENANDADLTNRIREAEDLDVGPQFIGDFWEYLQDNPASPAANATLVTKLKQPIAYYAYSRHLELGSGGHSTAYGFVKKETPHSEPVDRGEKLADASKYSGIAFEYFEKVIDFINSNIGDYPNFEGRGSFRRGGLDFAISSRTS